MKIIHHEKKNIETWRRIIIEKVFLIRFILVIVYPIYALLLFLITLKIIFLFHNRIIMYLKKKEENSSCSVSISCLFRILSNDENREAAAYMCVSRIFHHVAIEKKFFIFLSLPAGLQIIVQYKLFSFLTYLFFILFFCLLIGNKL